MKIYDSRDDYFYSWINFKFLKESKWKQRKILIYNNFKLHIRVNFLSYVVIKYILIFPFWQ